MKGSMSRSNLWDFLPRHSKSYLWIAFLVAVFMVMALSENGIFQSNPTIPNSNPLSAQPPNPASYQASDDSTASTSNHQEFLATGNSSQPAGKHEENYASSMGLDPKDVVILVKTGATAIWRRMPAHMSTTLGNPHLTPNVIYYSDSPDNINGNPVVDVLANVSASLKSSPDFTLYHKAKEVADNNLYLESGSMEGDHYLPGGWRLDKYKFLPMFQHAANHMPGKKWYVYMEDDNYFFWETLYAWLGTLNHTSPIMVGSPAFRLGEDFAHGGSGFAISGAALAATFGADKRLADRWEDYAKERCCGDQVLSHVMHDMGVERYKGLDGGSWAALQALPTWRIGFGRWNWCSPIMNIHKVHQSDISKLYVFEKEFKARTKVWVFSPEQDFESIMLTLNEGNWTSTIP